MISLNWLPETAYFFILIFARVGSTLMLIPALGETVHPGAHAAHLRAGVVPGALSWDLAAAAGAAC